MFTIVKQKLCQEQVNTVNLRELHAFLEVGKDFSTWIKNRIKQYGFSENTDYVLTLPKTGERQNVVVKEYHSTLDMAKELSMVERNEKGKEARKYFIECERRAKEAPALKVPQSMAEALRLAADQAEQLEKVTAQNQKMIPVIERHKALTSATGLMKFSEAAKAICNMGIDTGQNRFTKWLRENGYLFRSSNEAKQSYIQQGLFKVKSNSYNHPHTGDKVIKMQTYVTPKGVDYFAEKMKQEMMA